MKQSEAVRVVGILNAYFPARPIPQETVALWATELAAHEYEDAIAAVRDIGTNARFMPALAEVLAATDEERKARIQASRPALPAGVETYIDLGPWLEAVATPEERRSLSRFIKGLKARKEGQR